MVTAKKKRSGFEQPQKDVSDKVLHSHSVFHLVIYKKVTVLIAATGINNILISVFLANIYQL